MMDRIDLDPTTVPADDIPDVLGELERARAALWRRLTAPAATTPTAGDGSLLTLDQAAAFLGKSRAWLRRKAAAGMIPCARRVGRSWRFPAGDLERYVARVRQVG
jgi:excisionase family DNA binding protein